MWSHYYTDALICIKLCRNNAQKTMCHEELNHLLMLTASANKYPI